jgi:hypothetical protein
LVRLFQRSLQPVVKLRQGNLGGLSAHIPNSMLGYTILNLLLYGTQVVFFSRQGIGCFRLNISVVYTSPEFGLLLRMIVSIVTIRYIDSLEQRIDPSSASSINRNSLIASFHLLVAH